MGNMGNRMKEYENAYRNKLTKRMPVIIRIDGKSFHTYTKGMKKPFDEKLAKAFWETSKYLCKNIAGCKLAYHQSDEISLLLTNYEKLTTESWFDNNIQKIVSVAASMATLAFNKEMNNNKDALFDARAFIIPSEEVNNYFLWRQNDATRNSISMLAQSEFTHKSLQGLNSKQMQDKLVIEKGINWNDLEVWKKRGLCVRKEYFLKNETRRTRWVEDMETPVFSEDKAYIESHL